MAATQHSIRLVKTFPYRGDPVKQFSNRYYFNGGAPADTAAWTDLADGLVLLEKTLFYSSCHIVAAHGYGPGSEVPLFTKTYTTAGTLTIGSGVETPGDCAVVMRQATTKLSSKNHTVYVFSYYHQAFATDGGTNCDQVLAAQKTAATNFGAAWNTGIAIGARTYKRTTPDGHLVTGALVDPWVGHRDFPR